MLMATGYLAGGICQATLIEYASHKCAEAGGSLSSGGYQTCASYDIQDNSVILNMVVKRPPMSDDSYMVVLAPQQCEYPSWSDTYIPILVVIAPIFALVFVGSIIKNLFSPNAENV